MKIYAISDTHFGHKKLVEYGRPEGFSEIILKNLQNRSGDLLIHCGDFCIGGNVDNHTAFMEAAKGFKNKVLVRGNHDPQSDKWYYEHGWDFVCERFENTYFGKRYVFTHIPIPEDKEFYKNIHGHMHGNSHRDVELGGERSLTNWHFDLAPEIRMYGPVNLEMI